MSSAKKAKIVYETSSEINPIPLLYKIVPPIILSAITAVLYYPSLRYDFQFDDVANITRHFNIRHATLQSLYFSGTRWISYWLNAIHYSMSKFDPISYRIGNVAIHTINGLIVYYLLLYGLNNLKKRSFFKDNASAIALLTSLMFLLHPVQTQTVSYVIQGQLEGLATFFMLSMTLCLLKLTQTKNSLFKGLLTGVLFALAIVSCGSKEIAIISPALLMIFDWFFIAQGSWQSFKKRSWIYAALAFAVVGIYLYFLKPAFFTEIFGFKKVVHNNIGNVITQDPKSKITTWMFFISQFKVIIHYLAIFIWPFNLSVEYDWVLVQGLFAADCIVPLLMLLGMAYGTYQLLKKDSAHLVAFSAIWFFVCILPRSSIIPSPELLVDYKTYMASFAWLMLLASGIIALINYAFEKSSAFAATAHYHRHAQLACVLLLAAPLGYTMLQRNQVWSSGLAFWGDVLKNAPNKARAYNNYGVELSQTYKKYKEAIPYFVKAIKMDNNYPDPCNNLAVAYSSIGETDMAIQALKRSIALNPYYPEGYNNLASFFLKKQDYAQAEKVLMTALQLRPHYGKAYFNLGRVYLDQNQKEKAHECFHKACTIADLDNEFGFSTYAKSCLSLQKWDEAVDAFNKSLEFNPTNDDSLFNLGNCYFFAKRYDEAIATYERLARVNPHDVRAPFNIGETYFTMGNIDKSLEYFNRLTPYKKQLPQLGLRIASCHEKLGDPKKAQNILQGILHDEVIPDAIKNLTKSILVHLEKRYNLPQTNA